jgi:WD40 repeat protein
MRQILSWAILAALPGFGFAQPSYYRDVRPILQKNCQSCHQPASKMSGLDLTTFEAFKAGGTRGAAFAPGAPEESLTVKFMTGAMKPPMPLGLDPLPAESINLIREWIRAGARDDSPAEAESTEPTIYHQPPVITALAFSPDGKHLAVSGNREVLLHPADGRGPIQRLQGRAERILSLAFSKDGSILIAGGGTPARSGEVQIWDAREGKLLRTAHIEGDTVFGASLSPDGARIAVGCTDNSVQAFETATAKELFKINSHENWALATVFGVDSKRLVSVGRDGAAKLTDANAGQFLENVNKLRGELSAVARHPAKDVIVVGGEDRIPYIYTMDRPRNLKVGEEATLVRELERQGGAILALNWSPDGKRIAVAGAAPGVNLYDAETGERLASCTGHSAGIYALAFSPDGAALATGGFDGQVRLYDSACKLVKEFVPVPISAGQSSGGLE